jgi:3-methyl-2-oxobutanoate hydroxymethyltransferase
MSHHPAPSGTSDLAPVTVPDFLAAPGKKRLLSVVSLYDYPMARLFDEAGADCLLVGDSLGMVVRGEPDSLAVTLDEMIYHAKAVVRGAKRALVVVDMPFMSYQISPAQAVENAGRILKETGAHAVKLEGGMRMAPMIEAIVNADIPVMGHVGLTPQSVRRLGGFRVQRNAAKLLEDARSVEAAGAFSIVLECVPTPQAEEVSKILEIPTIGIGAGPHCDGQVLVAHDLLGLTPGKKPRFVRQFANLSEPASSAASSFVQAVREGTYPAASESYQ